MSNRFKGHGTLNTTYDINYWGPLDSRLLVPTLADLYDELTWTPTEELFKTSDRTLNAYNGMIVAVANDESFEGIFCLKDVDNISDPESWLKIDNSGASNPDSTDTTNCVKVNILESHELPAVGEPNILYMLPNSDNSHYTEYLWINGKFEIIGNIQNIDLSNYYTKGEVDTQINILSNRIDGLSGGSNTPGDTSELQESVKELHTAVGGLTDVTNTHTNQIAAIFSDLTKKVDTQEGHRLINPDEISKLAALKLNNGSLEVSGKIQASNVEGLQSWLSENATSAGLVKDDNPVIAAVSALMNKSSYKPDSINTSPVIDFNANATNGNIINIDTWISANRDIVDGLLSNDNQAKLAIALTQGSELDIGMLRNSDNKTIIFES